MAHRAIVLTAGLLGLALALATTARAHGGQDNPATGAATSGNTQSRGVMILRPAEAAPAPAPQPDPSPHPQPVAKVSPPPVPAPIVRSCARPFAHADVALTDGRAFNSALRNRLARKSGAVIVDIPHPFPIGGATPAALAPWLTEVKASGGLVSVDQYCQESRGLFSFLRGLLNGAGSSAYKAVDGYDAVFHVDGAAGAVTQVEFKPRAGE